MSRFRTIAMVAVVALAALGMEGCAGLGDVNPFDQDTAGSREDAPRVSTVITVNDSPTNAYGQAQNATEAASIGAEEGARSGTATPSGTSTPTTSPTLMWRMPDGSLVPAPTPPAAGG